MSAQERNRPAELLKIGPVAQRSPDLGNMLGLHRGQ
jgi:hypothetical protein